jgi:4'-phosphopantetheinyl transferase EntD
VLERILPEAAVVVTTKGDREVELFPDEREALGRAVEKRRRGFVTSRARARDALARLGIAPQPIPSGSRGKPVWPAGVVGSITHCAGYRLAAADPAVSWGRLLFGIKESIYKAWFPLTRSWLGFEDASVSIDRERGTFSAHLLVPGPTLRGRHLDGFNGRWLVASAIAVPAAGRRQRFAVWVCAKARTTLFRCTCG